MAGAHLLQPKIFESASDLRFCIEHVFVKQMKQMKQIDHTYNVHRRARGRAQAGVRAHGGKLEHLFHLLHLFHPG
jgi:hypothetical protein